MLDQIVEAVRHYNGLNVALRRTGKNELFERKAPQLVGMSRGVIREGVATLLAAGRLVDGPEGLSVADDQFPAAPTGQSDV